MNPLTVRLGHASLQFSDTRAQKQADLDTLFERALKKDYWWLTGTEAGEMPYTRLLHLACQSHGFRLHRWRGNWIAVQRERIKRGTWDSSHVFVAKAGDVAGPGHDLGFPWASFENPEIGTVSVAAVHFATKGRRKGDPNHRHNVEYATKLGTWGRLHGRGRALAFVHGDVNTDDGEQDVFHGQPFTTAWDAVGKWPNTHGAGTIDVIASYDKDSRVVPVKARTLRDRQLHLHSDHQLIEAEYQIRPLA